MSIFGMLHDRKCEKIKDMNIKTSKNIIRMLKT